MSVYMSVSLIFYLIIYRYIYLSVYLSFYISFHPSIPQCIYLSVYLSTYPSIHLSLYLFIYLSVNLSIHLSIYAPPIPEAVLQNGPKAQLASICNICLSLPFLRSKGVNFHLDRRENLWSMFLGQVPGVITWHGELFDITVNDKVRSCQQRSSWPHTPVFNI